ncbi:transposase [Actinoplanes siamensis]|uniref:Transposase n=1 Tax=Actinoplanes siamensis TaxID=1223317 RepID=A0A919TPF8_9ACTN|nr:transposase [Actinoplanes siamensis]GIF09834.1 hypothetical protein Asi03nite_73720 [Actinoplanes siamensis]
MELLDHGLMAVGRKYLWHHRRSTPDELRQRAVRLYRDSDLKPVIKRLAEQLNVRPEALRNWIGQAEADAGERSDRPTTDMLEESRRLLKENAGVAPGERNPEGRERVFRLGARPDPATVLTFINEQSGRFAVALLLRVLQIGESTYYA